MGTLARIPEDSCSSSLLTLKTSLVAFICNLVQGLCQGIHWLLQLLSPHPWRFWSPLPLVPTQHSLGTRDMVEQSVPSQVP